MGRILHIAAILLVVLLAFARPAHAVLGMCTITGTVYHVDGSVAAKGTVNFRIPTTQTFSADSVQTSLEAVTLDNTGSFPAGVQVPLGARIFIQVDRDKPVSVVVTNNPANCPLPFGILYGSGTGGIPIPSTLITSINTVNNIPGITDTATNPPGAGAATLTLNDQLPISFGSATSLADLSGAAGGNLLSVITPSGFGPFLQLETPVTTSPLLGQLTFGSPNTSDAEKRDAVIQGAGVGNIATHAKGQMNFFLADGTGTALGTLGPTMQLNYTSANPIVQFNGNNGANGPTVAELTAGGSGTAAQTYMQVQSNVGPLFMGVRGSGFTGGDVPAAFGFLEAGGGTSGLYLVSDATTGDEGIHFAANGQIAAGNLQLTQDASGNFFWQLPGVNVFFRNANNSMNVEAENIYNTAGGTSQAGFFVANSNGIEGGFSSIGNSSTGFGAPYFPNTTYVNSDGGPLLLYSTANLKLAASGQGAVGTLEMSEDASNNFFFEPTNTTGLVRFSGGGTGQAVEQIISTGNNNQDYLQIYPQNITQGVGITFNEIHEIGSNGNNALDIESQSSGPLEFNASNAGSTSGTWSFSSLGTVNNHHTFSSLNSGTQPSISSCDGGATEAMRAGSVDVAGEVDITGSGTIASHCLINFGAGWGANPICTCSVWNGGTLAGSCGTNTSTTQMNLWTQTSFSVGGHVTWHCDGLVNDNGG